jgi:hypothetical protein
MLSDRIHTGRTLAGTSPSQETPEAKRKGTNYPLIDFRENTLILNFWPPKL